MRGGAGRNQGRKPKLTTAQEMLVGIACEKIWNQYAEREAIQAYEIRPNVQAIRFEQARTSLIPIRLRKLGREIDGEYKPPRQLEDISESIDDIVKADPLQAVVTKRPHGMRDALFTEVIAWCAFCFGVVISKSAALKHWERVKAVQERLRNEAGV